MARMYETKNKLEKRFLNGFNILGSGSKHRSVVWSELMELFAIEISNSATRLLKDLPEYKEVWEEREQRYIQIMQGYSEHERNKIIPQMFSALVINYNELESFDDVLGRLYMCGEIYDKNKAQIFTPYTLAYLSAKITIDKPILKKAVKENGFCTIDDCAVGGGAMLLAAVDVARKHFNRLNWQECILCYGQDIDQTALNMAYIQLSLYCIPAILTLGNTISEPIVTDPYRRWETPMINLLPIWQARKMQNKL